jgi:hypothetical protein
VFARLPCSTPFGITEFGTKRSARGVADLPGAQRLSASLNSAQLVP